MKLNKFLTVLAPIAVVGTICPAIVSCGCSGDNIVINYKDNVNCKEDKKDDKDVQYHSLSTVQTAIKLKVADHERGTVSVDAINDSIAAGETQIVQNIYYDLVASLTILTGSEIFLTGYDATLSTNKLNVTFNLDGAPYTLDDVQYKFDQNVMYFGSGSNQYKSYTYKDCTPA